MAPLINQDIDSLIGGVSQQPAEIRKDSQVTSLDNATLDPAVGLAKRPGTEVLAALTAPTGDVFWHEFDGGAGHRYLLRCQSTPTGGSVDSIDLSTGVVSSIPDATSNSYSYLANAGRLSFVTVGDRVYIANDAPAVAMSVTAEVIPPDWVLMEFKDPPLSIDRQAVSRLIIGSVGPTGEQATVLVIQPSASVSSASSSTLPSSMAAMAYDMLTMGSRLRGVIGNNTTTALGVANGRVVVNAANYYGLANSTVSGGYDYQNMMQAYNQQATGIFLDQGGSLLPGNGNLPGWIINFVPPLNQQNILPGSLDAPGWGSWQWENLNNDRSVAERFKKFPDSQFQGSSILIGYKLTFGASMSGLPVLVDTYGLDETTWSVFEGNEANVTIFDSKGGPLLEELPHHAPDGLTTRITTDSDSESDYYFLQYQIDKKAWIEHYLEGENTEINATTMPHAINYRREADALATPPIVAKSFEFNTIAWSPRKVGDHETHTAPSFVGGHINDMVLFKDRLVFASGQNVVFSETREPDNFWRTTMTQLLDSDRLDLEISAGAQGAGTITSITPAPQGLLISTERAQFLCTSGDNSFTGANVTIDTLSRQEASIFTTPVLAQERVYFTSEYGQHSRTWEYLIGSDRTGTAIDVTGHCPTYLVGTIKSLSTNDVDNTVYAISNNIVYVYRYLQGQNQRLQAAWGRWLFAGNVEYSTTVGGETYFASNTGLVKLLKPSALDACGWQVHLDWRHTPTSVAALTGADAGHFGCDAVVGLFADPTWLLVDLNTGDEFMNIGSVAVPKFKGDPAGRALTWGIPYETSAELSPFILKKSSALSNQVSPYVGGRTQLKTFRLNFHNSGPFSVYTDIGGEVSATTSTHSNIVVGGGLGVSPPADGEFLSDVGGNATETKITIKSDSRLPLELSSANMEVIHHRRGNNRG